MIVANQMLKSMGVPNDELNHWTALIGFAWVFKPLWSPFLELASSKSGGGLLPGLGGLCLGGVALALHTPFWFAATGHAGTGRRSAATHDIACDGLYITSLDEKARRSTPAGPAPSSTPASSSPRAACCCWPATSRNHGRGAGMDHQLLHPRRHHDCAGPVQQLGAAAGEERTSETPMPPPSPARCGR
jgi:hypothetical protein